MNDPITRSDEQEVRIIDRHLRTLGSNQKGHFVSDIRIGHQVEIRCKLGVEFVNVADKIVFSGSTSIRVQNAIRQALLDQRAEILENNPNLQHPSRIFIDEPK